MNLKIFSFFSGSGFLDLGFELNGYTIDLVNEFSPAFINAYKYSRMKMGLSAPKYGYSNIDINEYLFDRADELRGYISDARKDNDLVGLLAARHVLIFRLQANSAAETVTMESYHCHMSS